MTEPFELLRLVAGVLALAAVALAALRWTGRPLVKDAVVAVLRGVVQLAAVALVIGWIFANPVALAPYLAVMLVVAAVTATRRVGVGRWLFLPATAAIGAGAGLVVLIVLASGALEPSSSTVLPYAAQVIGGTMTAVAVTGMRMRDEVVSGWAQVEAWLALGATARQAMAQTGRLAVARSVVPALDQTRAAGLVTLPGAFVGLLLGGASPWQAAELQVLVLVGLLAAEAVGAVLLVLITASGWVPHRPVAAAVRP